MLPFARLLSMPLTNTELRGVLSGILGTLPSECLALRLTSLACVAVDSRERPEYDAQSPLFAMRCYGEVLACRSVAGLLALDDGRRARKRVPAPPHSQVTALAPQPPPARFGKTGIIRGFPRASLQKMTTNQSFPAPSIKRR